MFYQQKIFVLQANAEAEPLNELELVLGLSFKTKSFENRTIISHYV